MRYGATFFGQFDFYEAIKIALLKSSGIDVEGDKYCIEKLMIQTFALSSWMISVHSCRFKKPFLMSERSYKRATESSEWRWRLRSTETATTQRNASLISRHRMRAVQPLEDSEFFWNIKTRQAMFQSVFYFAL